MIPITQYLRPNGRKLKTGIDRPSEIEELAFRFIDKGGSFEAEILMTGDVSLTACKGDEDIDGEVIPNGPQVPEAMDRLVRRVMGQVVEEVKHNG